MKLCNYINIYKILHKIEGISQSLHKHYPSKRSDDKHRRASSAKLPQAVLAVCLSAAQPLAAFERVPFFPYSLSKQRIGRGVYLLDCNLIQLLQRGRVAPFPTNIKITAKNKKGSKSSLSANKVFNYSPRAQPGTAPRCNRVSSA